MGRTRTTWFSTQHQWIALLLLILPRKRKAGTWRGQHQHLAQPAHLATRPQQTPIPQLGRVIKQRIRFVDFISLSLFLHFITITQPSTSTRTYASQSRSDSTSYSAEGASYESPAQPAWTYPSGDHNTSFNSRSSPSIQSLSLRANLKFAGNGSSSDSTGPGVYRNWGGNETGYETTHNYSNSDRNVDPALRTPSTATSDSRGSKAPWSQSSSFPIAEEEQNGSYGQGVFQQGSYTPCPQVSTIYSANQAIAMTNPARQTYTRTLVGPLSANASRLLDEHRKPGIFFLFQDLSVRTEG